MSKADRQRRWRAKKGARTGQPGRRPVHPCGTHQAYRRHLYRAEEPCADCKAAWAAEKARRRALKRGRRTDDG